ncbi:putative COPII coat assembly protein SEC16 [Cucumis melo var. makuwa]|uniref:Putative COPII coat assembly protein SEC16 n=1 Tax=Cucumis melo var. makuwa TaxID=1194695 RepID=A0A5D3C6C7_CUCMM|nr:putative COPII coat assembly protein SEC16 [Cucumis melo var. makuwa]
MAKSAAQLTYPPPSPSLRRTAFLPSSPMPPPNADVSPPPPPSPINLALLSFKSSSQSYTSLKDILPSASAAAVNSPTAASPANSPYEISIRNRLVKQAAWAYLQPMSASSYSAGPNFFHRFCLRFSTGNPIYSCFGFITSSIIPAIIRAFRFCICL